MSKQVFIIVTLKKNFNQTKNTLHLVYEIIIATKKKLKKEAKSKKKTSMN